VFPTSGSARGGTQISVTLNVPIDVYSDNIKVLVGGEMNRVDICFPRDGWSYILLL